TDVRRHLPRSWLATSLWGAVTEVTCRKAKINHTGDWPTVNARKRIFSTGPAGGNQPAELESRLPIQFVIGCNRGKAGRSGTNRRAGLSNSARRLRVPVGSPVEFSLQTFHCPRCCRRQSLCRTSCIPVLPQSLYPADILNRSAGMSIEG